MTNFFGTKFSEARFFGYLAPCLGLLLCLTSLATLAQTQSESTPAPSATTISPAEKRWELGVGIGGLTTPDYRGSKTNRSYIAPIPYVVYRGPVIRTDREGVRGDFLRTDRMEFTASLGVSFTPDNHKNELRQGMPELASTLEGGPALHINLTGDSLREGLSLFLPVRAVMTVGKGSPQYIGLVSTPSLIYRQQLASQWHVNMRAGPMFASGKYHNYYYTVEPQYALPERPTYDAGSGYSGFNTQIALTRRHGDFWYAFYGRYANLADTDFLDSPLVETRHNFTAGFAISWVLY